MLRPRRPASPQPLGSRRRARLLRRAPGCQRDRITVDDEDAGRGIRPKPVEQTRPRTARRRIDPDLGLPERAACRRAWSSSTSLRGRRSWRRLSLRPRRARAWREDEGRSPTYPGHMARSPLTLAASVTSALPRVGVVGAGALTEGAAGRFDTAVAELDDGRRVVVRAPADPDAASELAAEVRALRALTPGVRGLLPFRAPELLGEAGLGRRPGRRRRLPARLPRRRRSPAARSRSGHLGRRGARGAPRAPPVDRQDGGPPHPHTRADPGRRPPPHRPRPRDAQGSRHAARPLDPSRGGRCPLALRVGRRARRRRRGILPLRGCRRRPPRHGPARVARPSGRRPRDRSAMACRGPCRCRRCVPGVRRAHDPGSGCARARAGSTVRRARVREVARARSTRPAGTTSSTMHSACSHRSTRVSAAMSWSPMATSTSTGRSRCSGVFPSPPRRASTPPCRPTPTILKSCRCGSRPEEAGRPRRGGDASGR